MKYIYIIALLIFSFGTVSCSDNLDLIPAYSINANNSVLDAAGARTAVNGIYKTIVDEDHFSGKVFVSFASRSGFVQWSSSDYKMEYTQSNETTTNIPNRWEDYYRTINAANFAISKINELPEVEFESGEKNAIIGEAKCLRAFANMFLFWNYGHWWTSDDTNPNGVFFRDGPVKLQNIDGARLNVGESYAKIFEDLDFAIKYLGSFTSNRYVSKEFAKVLKAKIILYRNGFNDSGTSDTLNEALSLINEVLDTSVSGFSMQGDLAQVYEDSWDSEENLFSSYVSDNPDRINNISYAYSFNFASNYGNRVPSETYDAGLKFGLAWFTNDPRWDIVTGECRSAISWDATKRFTWTKLARRGQYDGQHNSPQDLKYNTYYFRYPELYILKSELLARTGASISEAIAPINTMRSKRTNPVLPSLNPTTQQELMDAIFIEYFLETFSENGSEYFASLRFKDESGQLWIDAIKEEPLNKDHLCYPIPNAEMQNNPLMNQNTNLQ
ncbi:MAG: RagB/SusD family nutrient uptake outer membrane protein [Algibacter sp.]